MLFHLGATNELVQRTVLLVFADKDGVVLVDTFPIEEKHIAGFQSFKVVAFVEHHRVQRACFAEEIAHRVIALLVQFVGRKPYPSHSRILAFATYGQFIGQLVHQGAYHHRLTAASGSLEHQSLAVVVEVEHLYHLLFQLTHSLFLIVFQFNHSAPPFI